MSDNKAAAGPAGRHRQSINAGLRASVLFTVAVRTVALVRALVLARLIGPSAFGLFAGIMAFTTVVALVAEFGFTPYVVHLGSRARDDARTISGLSLATGLLGALVMAGLAVPISLYYQLPAAKPVTLVLAVSVLITTLTAAPAGVLRSEFRFKQVGAAQLSGEVVGLLVAVLLAIRGAGVWALVANLLVAPTIGLGLLWLMAGIGLPTLSPGWSRTARRAVSYGVPIVGGAVVWAVALQGDNVIVGRALGNTSLGLYALAYSYGTLPGVVVAAIVGPVAFPAFARAREHPDALRAQFIDFVRLAGLVLMPVLAIGVALAPTAVSWVLGDRWSPAAQPLRLFILVGGLRALFPSDQVLRAVGQTKWELIVGLFAAPATVTAAILGSLSGILLVAALVGAVGVAASLWTMWVGARIMRLRLTELLGLPLPAALAGLAAGLAAWLGLAVPGGPALKLAIGIAAAAGVYGVPLAAGLLPGRTELLAVLLGEKPTQSPGEIAKPPAV